MTKKDYMIERNAEPLGDADGDVELHSLSRKGVMSHDEHDMQVLGRIQQLNVSSSKGIAWCIRMRYCTNSRRSQRNFRFISTLGFACTLMSTWEIALM